MVDKIIMFEFTIVNLLQRLSSGVQIVWGVFTGAGNIGTFILLQNLILIIIQPL